jgi:hypothetical protein
VPGRPVSRRSGEDAVTGFAHQRKRRLCGDDLLGIVGMEPGVRDDAARETVAAMNLADPAGLADLVGAVPLRFAMHRRQDVVAGRIAAVVLGQVVPAQRGVVPHEEIAARLAYQVRMLPLRQIPQVMVRIDQRDRIGRVVPVAMNSARAGLHCRAAYVYNCPSLYTKALRCGRMSRSTMGC